MELRHETDGYRPMKKTRVLLVGESWVSSATHYKGFDHFVSTTFHLGAEPLAEALRESPFDLEWMKAHEVAENFPSKLEELSQYGAIILSDIGSNSFLLSPDVWLHGKPSPNRLKLLKQWTAQGGGLVMVGGYLTFQGIDGRARWHRTPVEDVLPVTCLPYDDRIEIPEGFSAVVTAGADHPVLAGISGEWPLLLGVNQVATKSQQGVEVLARLPDEEGGHPLLVTGTFGKGRTVAWTSDIGPHWLPATFSAWPGYAALWRNILGWVSAA